MVPAAAEGEGGGVAAQIPKVLTSIARTLKATASGGGEREEDEEEEEGEEEGDDDVDAGTAGGLAAEDGLAGAMGAESTNSRPIFQSDAELVRPYGVLPGRLLIGTHHLRFLASLPAAAGGGGASGGTSGSSGSSGSSGGGAAASEHEGLMQGDWSSSLAKDCAIVWRLSSVRAMHRRRYLMDHSAIELFDDAGEMLLFNFKDKRVRSAVRRWIKKKCPLEYRDRDRSRAGFRQLLHELQEQWHRRELSNFEYLMKLNELAGRTHNDLNQYPVFPWVLADYTSEALDLHDPATFRDLSRPMGAQTEEQREVVSAMFDEFTDPDIPKFHYGSHYSTAGFVLYYLMRVEPFTSYHKALQSGRFDHADRLFHSLERTYHSCTHSSSDVKELIPELFYLPDLLLNRNRCDLGTRQDGQAVDDVVLPRWASDAADFVAKHRAALESDYVSAHLHLGIDLIFGCKQRGKPAVDALNKFFYLTYEVDFRGRTPWKSAQSRRRSTTLARRRSSSG